MRGWLEGTFDIYLQFCKELAICCICELFIYAESPKHALHPLCICHMVFTGNSCNKTFPDGSIYDSCLVYFVPMVMHVLGFSPPGVAPQANQGNMLVKTRGWIGFCPFLLSSKERGKGGEGIPRGGTQVYVELCR